MRWSNRTSPGFIATLDKASEKRESRAPVMAYILGGRKSSAVLTLNTKRSLGVMKEVRAVDL